MRKRSQTTPDGKSAGFCWRAASGIRKRLRGRECGGGRVLVSARPARALTSGAAAGGAMCVAWGVIVVRQGNRAVLLRRVRSRRRPPDGGASASLGSRQARRPRRERQWPRYAPHPAGGGRRGARPGARLRRARLVLRLVRRGPVPLLRDRRQLRGAPVQ